MSMVAHFLYLPLSIIVWFGKLAVDVVVNFWWAGLLWYLWALYKHHTL